MAAKQITIKLRVKIKFWFIVYIQGVRLISKITGLEPDLEKVSYWAKMGIKIEVIK